MSEPASQRRNGSSIEESWWQTIDALLSAVAEASRSAASPDEFWPPVLSRTRAVLSASLVGFTQRDGVPYAALGNEAQGGAFPVDDSAHVQLIGQVMESRSA